MLTPDVNGVTTETNFTPPVAEQAPADVKATPPAPAAEDQKADSQQEPAAPEDSAQSETTEKTQATETTEQQEAKKQSRFQRRLDRHKAEKIQAQTEARLLRERLAELEARQNQQQKPEAGEPKRENFESYEDFLEAKAVYKAEQKVNERLNAEREVSQKQRQQQGVAAEAEKLAQSWTKREQDFISQNKDYTATVTPFVEEGMAGLDGLARRAIVESQNGPALLMYLAANPEIAEEIAELSPLQQIAELGALKVRMTPAAKQKSSAPAPIRPGNSGKSAGTGYSENMTDAQYYAWRKSQGAKWAQG